MGLGLLYLNSSARTRTCDPGLMNPGKTAFSASQTSFPVHQSTPKYTGKQRWPVSDTGFGCTTFYAGSSGGIVR
jgi:hypothetical protein